jgi:hypothetical protein
VSYDGSFNHYVPAIIQLHGGGKSPSEIANAIDDQSKVRYPLSSSMVRYILRREGYVVPVAERAKYRTPRRDEFIIKFKQEWKNNENARRISRFECDAYKLYVLSGWLAEAINDARGES